MFNTIKMGGASAFVTLNTPSMGIIQRSHSKSKFIKFHHSSPLAKDFFRYDGAAFVEKPEPGYTSSKQKVYIDILQLMAFGDGEFICEYIYKSDIEHENN